MLLDNTLLILPPSIEHLIETAVKVDIAANTRYLLNEPDTAWIVGPSEGDVFAWEYANEQFIPYFLIEMSPGDLILGSSPEMLAAAQTFFFVSSRPSTLYKIPLADLKASPESDPEARPWIADKLEKWTGKLLTHFATFAIPSDILEFPVGGSCDLEAGQKARLQHSVVSERKHRLAWLECTSGEVQIAEHSTLSLTAGTQLLYPFALFLWVLATTPSHIQSYITLEILDKPQLWDSIFDFHRKLFAFFEVQKDVDLQKAKERIAKKRIDEISSEKESMNTLGSLLDTGAVFASSQEGDALFRACDLIGQVLHVQMKSPSRTALTIDKQVEDIATLSGLFQRKIALKGKWWQCADHPLLAFYQETKQPVALINVSPTEFEFLNPNNLVKEKVTAENAFQFDTSAFVFHEPFMGEKITFIKLIRFAYKEAFKESYIFLVLAILTGLINLYLPFAMKSLFDSLTVTANITLLTQLSIGLVLAAIALGIFSISKNFATQRFNGISNNKLQLGLWGRILNFSPSFFRKKPAGELMGQFLSIVAVHTTINAHLITAFFSLIYTIFYMVQMFTFTSSLALIAFVGVFIPFSIYAVCAGMQLSLFKKITEMSGVIQGFIIQLIGGLGKIRVAGAENRFFKIWSRKFAEKKRLYLRYQRLQTVTNLTQVLFPLFATVIIYAFAIMVFKKQLHAEVKTITTGEFVGFAAAFGLFIASSLDLLNTLFSGLQIRPLWQSAQTLLEEPLEKSIGKERAPPFKGKVVFDHVSYRYNPEDELTLKDIVIEALPGEMIAIIGPSGSGKSTLVRLLLGFETPESGAIYFDDKSLDDFDPRTIRSQIGTVMQSASLMPGSIYDNIVGSGTYPPQAIERAIRFSGFEADLKRLPMGLHTIIPMGGGSFSGGQKQRLMLARALVASPKMLILDEATSALDNKTQDMVTQHLDHLRVTRIVIAHRLSTIKNADRIYVLEKGQIVQTGTFQELAGQEGLFLSMLKRQTL